MLDHLTTEQLINLAAFVGLPILGCLLCLVAILAVNLRDFDC